MDHPIRDDRWYGARYAESHGEDLYRVSGRILSDLKLDQVEAKMPRQAVIVVAVNGTTITVMVFVQPGDTEEWLPPAIRARVTQVAERYNWTGTTNRNDRRFTATVATRYVRSRLNADTIGAIIGG